jgi:hypothetical protein
MPPLNQMIRSESPKGFAAVENPPDAASVSQPGRALGGNPYIRCPLPPFNATSDTLRQFNENGKIPTRRVIPLPISVAAGGGGSVTNVSVTNQGGGGSSGGSTIVQTKLVSATATLNVPSLTPGATFTATVTMAKSFQLLQLSASGPLEIRLYGDATTQAADLVRLTDSAVPFEILPGVITDVVFDTAPFTWNWQNRMGANADPVQSTTIYVTVVNPSQVIGAPSAIISIQYLPLES